MRVEHETLTSHLRSQLAVIQEEVERLRENSNLLKTKVAGLESDVKTRDVEIYDFRKRFIYCLELIDLLLQVFFYHPGYKMLKSKQPHGAKNCIL